MEGADTGKDGAAHLLHAFALEAQASRLADLLSNEHDLAVLSQTLTAEPEAFGGVREVDTVVGLIENRRIENRREEIRIEARLLGLRLYADKPTQFVKRFKSYWRAWQERS